MKIYEYRIICPTSLEKYRTGYQYMTAKNTYQESQSKKGEGIETIKNESYPEDQESSVYTYKILHFKSRVPSFIRWALPDKYCHLHEKSWNCFPHCHTVYSNPGLKDRFTMSIDSWHCKYNPNEPIPDNLLNLSPEELKIRKIVYLDILDGKPISEERDLSEWKCAALNIDQPFGEFRGDKKHSKNSKSSPPEWTRHFAGDMMVAVKILKIDFNWKAFQSMVEKYVTHSLVHNLFLNTHRDLMLWGDEWGNMTLKDVMDYENRIYANTNALGFERDDDKPDEILKDAKPKEVPQFSDSD